MRKLMWFAVGFALATAVGIYVLQGNAYFLGAGVAAVVLAVLLWLKQWQPKLRIGVVLLMGCMVGFVWLSAFDAVYLSVPRKADGEKLYLTVTATDYSRQTDYGVAVDGAGKINGKRYRIRTYLPKDMELSPGDRVTAEFSLRSTLPGNSAASTFGRSDHVFLTARTNEPPDIVKAESLPWYGYPAMVRQAVKATLNDSMTEDTAGFAVALLIGDKEGVDYETDTAFQLSGISHIIAVSGLHVTILFSLVYILVGRKRLPALLIGIPVLFFFAAVAGFSPSIMRACLMHSLMITAMLFNKEYDGPTALGFAVLVMLAVNPWTVTSVSFQLSVACMAGMFLFTEPIRQWLMDKKRLGRVKGRKRKLANGFSSSVGMSLGATVFVTPLCAWYFGMVSLVGTVTNLLTLWIITFIFYGLMATCLLGMIWPSVGKLLGWIIAWPVRYVLNVAKLMASFPLAAVFTDSIYVVIWLVFVYILLFVYLLMHKKQVLTMGCCALISLCVALCAAWTEPKLDECRVTVLNVGQGQCILLQSRGNTFVVDCGGDSDSGAADIAANALASQGVFQIDGLILTHYDRDHAAGAAYLMQRVPAQALYLPTCADEDGTAATLPHDVPKVAVSEIMTITFGEGKITLIPSKNDLSDNESGMCILFQTENCDILITGDRSTGGERELMQSIDLPKLEVLVVGHHGSRYSTDPALLKKTRPENAIISVGADNSYGHPAQEVLDRLMAFDCHIYRTDRQGTVVYRR